MVVTASPNYQKSVICTPSTVLITDGHYPASTAVGNNATTVNLNLEAGVPTVPAVLSLILATIPVERLTLIQPLADALPSQVQDEINEVIAGQITSQFIDRSVVYDTARSLNLALCIVTGGIRRFANVLLTVGVLGVTPGVEGAEPRRRNQDEDMTKLVTPTKRTGGKGSWLLAAHSHCHYGMIAMFAREKNG